jgi:hypothetical protein
MRTTDIFLPASFGAIFGFAIGGTAQAATLPQARRHSSHNARRNERSRKPFRWHHAQRMRPRRGRMKRSIIVKRNAEWFHSEDDKRRSTYDRDDESTQSLRDRRLYRLNIRNDRHDIRPMRLHWHGCEQTCIDIKTKGRMRNQ